MEPMGGEREEGRTGKTDIIQYNLNYYLYAKHVSMCYLYPLLTIHDRARKDSEK